ncbi:MAG TPA: RraA family protein [Methylomusa anaerophila]|uniref:4-hydroxy-4-methyl-2-oxoglutarate aldolase n=1 Tax=Methylomusa anaerophila TaxID=1930071 RepID=A0A348AFN2_9FIRM|nr:RraA family protein [Methylomusa anaerophila]BBB89880.1 4-hydroxy-4-methyl-2-oxoglutarate aldolase [Methylomusa anaerophila]HML89073.1 RraA family protein [Methylomusa anaerophila]
MQWKVLQKKILDYIQANEMSTTEVADAMYKTGELDPKLQVLLPGSRVVGVIHYIPAFNGSNYHVHNYARNTPKDSVVCIDALNCDGKAIFGDLVAKYLFSYHQVRGIVVRGLIRDVQQLIKEKYPIWSYGRSPIGCINADTGFDEDYYIKRRQELDGGIVVADDSGVVVIKKDQITEQLLERLDFIGQQEVIWSDCINRLRWDTFDTICLKKYAKVKC